MGFWDERFAGEEYVYGTEPNRWLVEQAGGIRPGGRVLSLGEGEGRNAVWLARQGFAVEAVEGSAVGIGKARRLAERHGVSVAFTRADLRTHRPEPGRYDAVVLIFVHMPPEMRAFVHRGAAEALAPGGLLVLEAFTPRQLGRKSGGPREAALLYEPAQPRGDFPGVAWSGLGETELDLEEGPLHRGPAAVVRGVGRRAVP